MPKEKTAAAKAPAPAGYAAASTRPLHTLVFLLPLIVLYEIGSNVYLTDRASGIGDNIRAHSILLDFFQDFGVAGRSLPALALVMVLLVQHSIRRDPWRIKPAVIAGMAAESALWTLPLLVLSALILRALTPAAGTEPDWSHMEVPARLTIAAGAGLYEELLFRLIGIAAVHLLLVDVLRLRDDTGRWVAVLSTAVAFALYHDVWTGGRVEWRLLLLFMSAGVYLGWLFLWRGFGIAVAGHTLYDAVVLVLPVFQRG